jgi:hypothetical protein
LWPLGSTQFVALHEVLQRIGTSAAHMQRMNPQNAPQTSHSGMLAACLVTAHDLTMRVCAAHALLKVVYSVLEPGSTRRYHTYCTHPWLVRELKSGTRMLLSGRPAVVGLTAEQTVEISAPPQLQWSVRDWAPGALTTRLAAGRAGMSAVFALSGVLRVASTCAPARTPSHALC